MRHQIRALSAVVLAATLILGACGRSGKGSTASTTTGGKGTGDLASPKLGTTTVGCGPNKTGKALGASDQGVTASEIRLATVSDVGFTGRPGLNQELFDASQVFARWCNDLGGINGRKIKIDERDAALFNYKQQIMSSCKTDFALVGGGGVFDDTGQAARLQCLLPNIPGYVVSAQARNSDLTLNPQPFPTNYLNVGALKYLRATFPSATKVGMVSGNVPSIVTVNAQQKEGAKAQGFDIVDDSIYNAAGEPTWTPFATKLKTNGAQGVIFTGEPANLAKLTQAMQSVNYTPAWVLVAANFYDQQFIELANGSAKNVYILLTTTPFLTSGNAAMDKYLALFAHYLPKGKVRAVLGQDSFGAWVLFSQAAAACGADLTRRCLWDNGQKVHDFDGGGLQAPADPGAAKPTNCFTLVTVTDGKFAQVDVKPNSGPFRCDPANQMTLKGNYGKGTKLADVGKSLADLP